MNRTRCLCFSLLLALLLPLGMPALADAATPAEPSDRSEAFKAAQAARYKLNLQTELPGEKVSPPEPEKPRDRKPWFNFSISQKSLERVSRVLFWAGAAVLFIIILRTAGNNFWSRTRSRPLSHEEAEAADPAAATARMEKAQDSADELAHRGDFTEAMHLLLLQSLIELRRRLDFTMASSLTSREILHRVSLSHEGKSAFSDIIGRVEISYFGTHEPGKEEYLACRRSFELLSATLGKGAV